MWDSFNYLHEEVHGREGVEGPGARYEAHLVVVVVVHGRLASTQLPFMGIHEYPCTSCQPLA